MMRKILSIILLFFTCTFITHAWVEPSDTSNIVAPLNAGSAGQSKAGGLILNTGGAGTGLLIPSGNVGFGTTNSNYPVTIQETIEGKQIYLKQSNTDNGWLLGTASNNGSLRFYRRGEGGSPTDSERFTHNWR